MKDKVIFCMNFNRNGEYNDTVQELNIILEDQTTSDLKKFLEKHQEQRINIVIYNMDYLFNNPNGIITDLKEVIGDQNVAIKLNWSIDDESDGAIRNVLKQAGLKYYYKDIVDAWDNFNKLAAAGVSDIYVGNSMGFQMKDVKAAAAKKKVRIRVYPNVAQSTWDDAPAQTKFFIRPEDCLTYSFYVDVFELFMPIYVQSMDEIYNIYKYEKKWNGDLQHIIFGLGMSIDNRLLEEHWCNMRLDCKKRCAIDGKCKVCDRFVEMSLKMSEKEKQLHTLLKK